MREPRAAALVSKAVVVVASRRHVGELYGMSAITVSTAIILLRQKHVCETALRTLPPPPLFLGPPRTPYTSFFGILSDRVMGFVMSALCVWSGAQRWAERSLDEAPLLAGGSTMCLRRRATREEGEGAARP